MNLETHIIAGAVALVLIGAGMFLGRKASRSLPPKEKSKPVEVTQVTDRQDAVEQRLNLIRLQEDNITRRRAR